jgi:response regulator of citrate/malate metabolism
LETLQQIKNINNDVPIVLITKNEEEYLMEDAIGSKIDDYLIKPVHPKQILLTIKKLTENKRLVTEKTTMAYQMDFRTLGMTLNDNLSHQEWVDVYKKLIYWELELGQLEDAGMHEILTLQKAEANTQFCKFVERNYLNWIKNPDTGANHRRSYLKRRCSLSWMANPGIFYFDR